MSQVINKLIHRRSKTTNIPYIEIDSKIVTESNEKIKELLIFLCRRKSENVISETQHSNTATSEVTSK